MSRATTTVLFTDIVGSTELRGRLGDDAAEELRRVHDRLLAQAVESNGGRMVKGLGDGIMATFAGASDAVAAAVAIQQEIDRLVRSGKVGVPLAVRVGVSAGLSLAEELRDQRIAVHAYHHRVRAAMETGDLAEAERCVERQMSLAAEIGEPTLRWMAAVNGVGLPLAAGQLAVVEEKAMTALAIAQDSQPDAKVFYAAQTLLLRYEQGRLDELLPTFLEMVADPDFNVPAAEAVTAFICCELDRPEEGKPYYETRAADRFDTIRFDHLFLVCVALCAEVAVRLDDRESAAVLSELLAPYSDLIVTLHSWQLNCVTHYLGLLATSLGRFEEAEAHFQATASRQLRLGTPIWLAHTRYEWARMLLARIAPGDVEQAQEMLGQVLATARELGLANVERRAVALMQ